MKVLIVEDDPVIRDALAELVQHWGLVAETTANGLGLSIARGIAQVHGGSIEAQSASSGGCRMVVQLPTTA